METEIHEHVLDDPYFDYAEDEGEKGMGRFLISLLFTVILGIGVWLAHLWAEPPVVHFSLTPPQMVPYYVEKQVTDPVHACGVLPPCPAGRACMIDTRCRVMLIPPQQSGLIIDTQRQRNGN
jgi:hypothetical protein